MKFVEFHVHRLSIEFFCRELVIARIVAAFAGVLLFGCAALSRPPADARWIMGPPMASARAAHAVAADTLAIYAIAGTDATGRPVNSVERFDGKAWRIVAPLPPGLEGGLNAPAAAILGNTLYLAGGFSATSNRPVDGLWALDLPTHAWRRLSPMPAPRGGHSMITLQGGLHVVGGGNDRRTLEDHLVYDPQTDAWRLRAPLPRAKGSSAAVVVNDQLVVIGGRSGGQDDGDVHRYDQSADRWKSLAGIRPRGTAGAIAHCGVVWLIGGESQSEKRVLGRVEAIAAERLFEGARWQDAADLPTPRAFARTVVFGGRLHVVGGAIAFGASHQAIGTPTVEVLDMGC